MMNIPTPCIFAHRGASASAPENTMSAFELAFTQGAHAIELDAKLSSDGEIVVIHDQTLNRTTTGTGYVHKTSYAILRSLDAGSWFSKSYANERIPLLSDVLDSFGKKMIINIEVTNYRTWWDDLPQKIAVLVRQFNILDSVIFSSFYPTSLWKIRRLIPGAATALLTGRNGFAFSTVSGLAKYISPRIQHPHQSALSFENVQHARQKGIRLHTWTVNEEADMRRLLKWGVDGLFTDHPATALTLIESIGEVPGVV
jgi:glycerophosphoryl diester phosphodiesterase